MARRGWHRERIKAALRERGETLQALATRWGYHRASVSNALIRPDCPGIHQRIAAELGVSPHILWPQWWSPDGVHIHGSSIVGEPSRPDDFPHRQKLEAA